MGMHKTWLALAAASTLALSGAAHAVAYDYSATLSWADPVYTLVDLTPLDGNAPGLTWTSQTTGVSVLHGSSQLAADWTSALQALGALQSASANATETHIDGIGITTAAGFLESDASRYGSFQLAPQTAVTFSLWADAVAGSPTDVSVLLNASIFISGTGAPFQFDGFSLTNGETASRLLTLTLTNDTDVTITRNFSSSLNVNAYPALPVPEPASYAMLLAGLGLLTGVAARRRRLAR